MITAREQVVRFCMAMTDRGPGRESVPFYNWIIWQWTGWKSCEKNDFLAAQWLACTGRTLENARFVFSSTPGTCCEYHRGETFNLSRQKDQLYITASSPEYDRIKEKLQALNVLLDWIEKDLA
jgi:hypothetical protein